MTSLDKGALPCRDVIADDFGHHLKIFGRCMILMFIMFASHRELLNESVFAESLRPHLPLKWGRGKDRRR